MNKKPLKFADMTYAFGPFMTLDGKPCKRTKYTHPYSYEEFVQFQSKDYVKVKQKCHVVYSDRLYQWDYEKYNKLTEKYFGNRGQYWNQRDTKDIESWLRDYMDDQTLELKVILEGCNAGNGFPYWVFLYTVEEKPNE